MENKQAPCSEKKCSVCCDPVKVHRFFPEEKIPLDKNGEKIWVQRKGLLAPLSHIDTERLKTFDCKKFDKSTRQCVDYDNRPDICRNTSCIHYDSGESVDDQHKKFIEEEFVTIT